MKQRTLTPVLILAVLALTGVMCSVTGQGKVAPTPNEAQKQSTLGVLQSTLDASTNLSRQTVDAWMTQVSPMTQEAGGQTPATTIPTGTIKGHLSYPGEEIPPLRIVAFNINTGEYASVEVKDRQDYTLNQVPEGEYQVVAYPMARDKNLSGGYSAAVSCGLQAECSDHTLVIVKVKAGEITADIDPVDWYAAPGTFPPQP